MQSRTIQLVGLGFTIAYASFIVWIYATEPRTFKEVTISAEVAAGTYEINQEKFNSALNFFRREQSALHKKSRYALLCATSACSVSPWLMNSEQKHTTETQSTQRLHREISEQGLFVQSRFVLLASNGSKQIRRSQRNSSLRPSLSEIIGTFFDKSSGSRGPIVHNISLFTIREHVYNVNAGGSNEYSRINFWSQL